MTCKVQAQPPPVIPEIAETTTRNHAHIVIKQSDSPKDLILTGAQTEDVVEIMTVFRSIVRINSTEGSSEGVVEQRAVRYLPFLVRDAAAELLHQLFSDSLE